MMKRMRVIYAMILAVIYITATSMSSISILSCEHHHHHHAEANTKAKCHCLDCECDGEMVALGEECCDHHHRVLGDNHTDFFVNNERNALRTYIALTLLTVPAIMADICCGVAPDNISLPPRLYGDERLPLMVAAVGTKALRAPPTLA